MDSGLLASLGPGMTHKDPHAHRLPATLHAAGTAQGRPGKVTVDLDSDGNPNYLLNPLLADLPAHIRMMDAAGIDAGVLSCGLGFDQPDLAICRAINDRMREAEKAHPGRFIGLAHVPALKRRRRRR